MENLLTAITPEEAITRLNRGERLNRVHITGHLTTQLSANYQNLVITESVIAGDLNIWESVIFGEWDLRRTVIQGNIETSEVVLNLNADWMELQVNGNMNLADIRIDGSLLLCGAKVGGCIDLSQASLSGYLDFDFAKPPRSINAGTLERAQLFHLFAPSVPLTFETDSLKR